MAKTTDSKEGFTITINAKLLRVLDHHCKKYDLDRSQATRKAIRMYLGTFETMGDDYWEGRHDSLMESGEI